MLVSQVLFFRHTKQTNKNVADTTVKTQHVKLKACSPLGGGGAMWPHKKKKQLRIGIRVKGNEKLKLEPCTQSPH